MCWTIGSAGTKIDRAEFKSELGISILPSAPSLCSRLPAYQ